MKTVVSAIGDSVAKSIIQHANDNASITVVITTDSLHARHLEHSLSFFNNADLAISVFPDWETLPFDRFSPHQDIISERLRTLANLPHLKQGIVIFPISTLMTGVVPTDYIDAHAFALKLGDRINLKNYTKRLTESGYRIVNKVIEHGELAIRGSIIDIFPMGHTQPYRIELFDDDIESIRVFDIESQRSQAKINSIDCLPAREFPLTESAITEFRKNWREQFSGNPLNCPIYDDISNGIASSGIEYYLPLFFNQTSTLFDYFPSNALIIRDEAVHQSAEHFWNDVNNRYQQLNFDVTRPLLKPDQLFLRSEYALQQCNQYSQIIIKHVPEPTGDLAALPHLAINRRAEHPLTSLCMFLNNKSYQHLIVAESNGRREVLLELLAQHDVYPTVKQSFDDFINSNDTLAITVGSLNQGFIDKLNKITLITEADLYGETVIRQRTRKSKTIDPDLIIRDLSELQMNTPVVHLNHGIGRYQGLQTLSVNDEQDEYLLIEYAGADKIYVPVTSLNLVSRYSGMDADNPQLNKLGHEKWSEAKRRALEKIRDVAAELLHLYATRAAKPGFVYKKPDTEYDQFAADFPFEETDDQVHAIENVINDMTGDQAMDRLICGDVGFGKTEVAMRAAFLAVQSNKQVAILVPTTLLASQHYENFKDRFANCPIRIGLLSRFVSSKNTAQTLDDLAQGRCDIIIGTHKLIQKNIEYKDLGLLIIDEEHRFGVGQKDYIKKLRANIDILSMTATPIPRTLNISMAGMRDISLIATPPARRLSIKTFCQQRNNALMREAILREIMRGGQVFFLHNNVDTIFNQSELLKTLIPEAKINVAHGQMRERDLETVMSDFYHQRFNVLICTTIIETGIDVPTANTIIIDRADRFGLAQLHQLRGRVGRSHHQAYAYLMTPDPKAMTKDATKRLEAIMSLEDLGAGFTLASHDMEIRGAGELLGEDQSGQMHTIGFTLYMELLNKAVKALQMGEEIDLADPFSSETEINLHIPALIPDDYCHDVHMRLTLYKRIANAEDSEQLKDLQVEMIDRFGLLPDATKTLFEVSTLKNQAKALGISKIDFNQSGGMIEFKEKPNIDPIKIITLIQTQPSQYQLLGPQKLKVKLVSDTTEKRLQLTRTVLNKLSN